MCSARIQKSEARSQNMDEGYEEFVFFISYSTAPNFGVPKNALRYKAVQLSIESAIKEPQ